MSREEVRELVLNVSEKQSPQPRISQRRLTDTEATAILQRICGEEPVLNMPKERQKNVVENAYAAGVGLRQLSRITKISYGAIVVKNRPFDFTIPQFKDPNTYGSETKTPQFEQEPSRPDISVAGTNTHYLFARGNGNVYIYTSKGVQAIMSMKYFVTPKTK